MFIYWIKKNLTICKQLYDSGIIYPAPAGLSYFWNYGSLAFVALLMQILSGIFLAMHYIAHPDLAFLSVEHIMRDVNYGWLIRYIHANGASFFFFVVYIHIFRGLYYGSFIYPRHLLWISGVIILLLMILTAFLGYVLPWAQMSYWAATVITNLVSTIPFIGKTVVYWLWGGYSVDGPTLTRFFSLHYLLPFLIVGLVLIHFILLHEHGSNMSLGIAIYIDKIPFHPYYTVKDFVGIIISFFFLSIFVFYLPNSLGHSDNYIPGDPCVTPTHIVPEWYFLPFYAILRSVPHKLSGVLLLLFAIVGLLLLPFLAKPIFRSGKFKIFYKVLCWSFIFNSIILGWIGAKTIEAPFYTIGQLATIYYFFFFLIVCLVCIEKLIILKPFKNKI